MSIVLKNEFDIFSCPLDSWALIEASAGTGKTWTIGALYLRLLLEKHLEVKEILVVTFTRAATDELRDRIRNRIAGALAYLDGRITETHDEFVKLLLDKLSSKGYSIDEMATHLRLAFQSFDQAAIFTIHGFCQRALTLSAFSSGKAFSIKVEKDDSELIQEVTNDFWRRHISGSELPFVFSYWLEKKQFAPDKLATLLKQHLAKPLATVKWPDTNQTETSHIVDQLNSVFEKASVCWMEEKEQIVTLLKTKYMDGALNKKTYSLSVIENTITAFDQFFAEENALTLVGDHKKFLYLATSKLENKTNKHHDVPQHRFFNLVDSLVNTSNELETALEIARYDLIKRFLPEAIASLKAKKQEQHTFAFHDMLTNLDEALRDPQIPWLADTIRKQFPTALIDEFQDTDPLQYAIFSAIYRKPGTPVFFVGDPKQAIYRFRNADLHTYLIAKKEIKNHYTLAENHRSLPGLINACNTLFSTHDRIFLQEGLDFKPVRPGKRLLPPLKDTSSATVDKTSELRIWMLPDTDESRLSHANAKKHAIEAVADEIARLILSGRNGTCTLGKRPVGAGDIAVLVRSHNDAELVRQTLTNRGIGSVSFSQENVFLSREAQELEYVLHAMITPHDTALLMAAASTEMMGLDSLAIESLTDNEIALSECVEQFRKYHQSWLTYGINYALQCFFDKEGVTARLLALPDGERRLTNLRHLTELITRESKLHNTPDALIRWYHSQRENGRHAEEDELRLETDQNLVQVITLHRSKGLEFPFVFCPFLWSNTFQNSKTSEDGVEYHENDKTIIDYQALTEEGKEIVKRKTAFENAAENMRLIYVALTRAIYRCYLVAGCYTIRNSVKQSQRSLLNWMVAGNGFSPEKWLFANNNKKTDALPLPINQISKAWKELEHRCSPHIHVTPLPTPVYETLNEEKEQEETLTVKIFNKTLNICWRMNSFSGLIRNATDETKADDHDERIIIRNSESSTIFPTLEKDDILLFPKGTYAGSCLHAVFENATFTDETTWEAAAKTALTRYPQKQDEPLLDNIKTEIEPLQAMVIKMLKDVTATPLPGGITLNKVTNEHRLVEWPFCLSSTALSAKQMNQLAKQCGYTVPQLAFDDMTAYLNGFIDLVFEANGQFWLLDWKSNHLGYAQQDYETHQIEKAMAEHGYHWQYLLYTVALHRYLALKIPNYDYRQHFGGVFYLFVRGVRPEWRCNNGTPSGVFFHKPKWSVIERIDNLFKQMTLLEKESRS